MMESLSQSSHTTRVLHNHIVIRVQHCPWLDWRGDLMSSNTGWSGLWLAADTVLLFWVLSLDSLAGPGLNRWKTTPTAKVAMFGSGVTSVTLSIPDIEEGILLPMTFDGSDVTHSDWRSWSSADIGAMAAHHRWALPSFQCKPSCHVGHWIHCQRNNGASCIGCWQWVWGMGTPGWVCRRPGCQTWGKPEEAECEPHMCWTACWCTSEAVRQRGMRALKVSGVVLSAKAHMPLVALQQCSTSSMEHVQELNQDSQQ